MTKKQAIQVFDENQVRTLWDDVEEKWYISIVDVVAILTDSKNPQAYWIVNKQTSQMQSSIHLLHTSR